MNRRCFLIIYRRTVVYVAKSRAWPSSSFPIYTFRRLCSSMSDSSDWNSVLDYWFGGGDPARRPQWFGGGEKVTMEIRDKFAQLVERARTDQLKHWEEDPKATLALIILQDQFCRNLFKGTPDMYAQDEYCQKLSKMLIDNNKHEEFDVAEKVFLYMPLMHSESREDQAFSVELYTQLLNSYNGTADEKSTNDNLIFAKLHKEVVDMFGRFPQRNSILGRKPKSPEEEEWLKDIPSKYMW